VNTMSISDMGPVTTLTRAAIVIVGLYLALAVGAPWLLYDAPPSAVDVLASEAYCASNVASPFTALR
jgi:hypothetical protein